VPRLEDIEKVYRDHHEARRPKSFVYCGRERGPLFREWVGTKGRVLDVGCRFGTLTRAYLDGNTVVGIDVDRQALEEARTLGIETVWADAADALPFDEESFDVVVLGELLEHLLLPERTVGEARRVLRPGGRLVGSVPNGHRLKSRLRFLLGGPSRRTPFADCSTTSIRSSSSSSQAVSRRCIRVCSRTTSASGGGSRCAEIHLGVGPDSVEALGPAAAANHA
jgi:2-polyprenyl-6-hydroxyphenyl methylase/3-demethylubiquinone-9 3-methyltransferase